MSKQKKLFTIYGGVKKTATVDGGSLRPTVESAQASFTGSMIAAGGHATNESVEIGETEPDEQNARQNSDDGPNSPQDIASAGADEIGISQKIELAQSMGYQKAQMRNLLLKHAELTSAEKHLDLAVLRYSRPDHQKYMTAAFVDNERKDAPRKGVHSLSGSKHYEFVAGEDGVLKDYFENK